MTRSWTPRELYLESAFFWNCYNYLLPMIQEESRYQDSQVRGQLQKFAPG